MESQPPTLLGTVREVLRLKHYSPKTEEAYLHWVKRLMRFYPSRHPRELSAADIEAFLTRLAVAEKVSASTQN